MLNDDLFTRITKVRNLREECFKYLEDSAKEMLAHQIIYSIAKLSSEKKGPVKLGEIAQDIYSINDKSKQDNIRLTIEKTLLKCGMVEKLRYAANDVRYILTGYRFQKTRKIESFRGDTSESIGEIFELPRALWPIPDEYFTLKAQKEGYAEGLKKLNSDYNVGKIQNNTLEIINREMNERLNRINRKINTRYAEIEEIVDK